MPSSPARLAANRANARLSTGPKTEAGKAASRGNALKHGMAGEDLALPGEDAAEVDRRFEAMEGDLRPSTELSRYLVRRAALMTVRVERCARNEAAALSARVLAAPADFDESRLALADRLYAAIASQPATHARQLRGMPEGVDRLIVAYEGLRVNLEAGRWADDHGRRMDELAGKRPEDAPVSRDKALSEAMAGDSGMLEAAEVAGRSPKEVAAWAADQMAQRIDRAIVELRDLRPTLDHEAIARIRAGSADRALFDTSKEAGS